MYMGQGRYRYLKNIYKKIYHILKDLEQIHVYNVIIFITPVQKTPCFPLVLFLLSQSAPIQLT